MLGPFRSLVAAQCTFDIVDTDIVDISVSSLYTVYFMCLFIFNSNCIAKSNVTEVSTNSLVLRLVLLSVIIPLKEIRYF